MTTPACPSAETLAAFGEGRLTRREVAKLADHLEHCEDCIAALAAVNETIATREAAPASRKYPWWLAAAAVVVLAASAIGVRVSRDEPAPAERLIRLMPASVRLVEARPSGGFPWGTYRGPMRTDEGDADPRRMQLVGMAGELVAAADRDRSSGAQQVAGVALVLVDKPLPGIERLQAASKTAPDDAAVWNDLAVAQYSAALRLTRPSLLSEALASADRALRIEPRHVEARFNRALILERLGLATAAREAWQRYLEVDANSPWANEARERMAKLAAANTGSDAQRVRTYAEAETLARWAEAAQLGDNAAARRELDSARSTGDDLEAKRGESLLREAVRAIDDASDEARDRATLAEAHLAYRRGRIAYSRRQLDAAVADLDGAAGLFDRSPMALVARYYAACARFDRSDVAAARTALETLLEETDAQPRFVALGAQVRWQLALTRMVDGDWSGALPLLLQSRDAFARLDERNHLGFLESLLADTLLSLGRLDEAWAARIRGFTLLSGNGSGDRMQVSVKAAAQMELRGGRMLAARALLDLARAVPAQSEAIAADVLTHAALVNVALGDRGEAQRALGDASAAADRIRDAAARDLAQAHVDLAGGAFALPSDPGRAHELLTRAIDRYRASDRTVFLPESFLLRARAAARGGRSDAFADLDDGIAALERSRIAGGAIVGTGVLNAGTALYEDAIRLSAERGELERAFAYAERSRMQLASNGMATVGQLQERLRGSNTAVLHVIALPEEIVTICVTERDAAMERRPMRNVEELYDAAIRPHDALLANRGHLIVVADRAFSGVSFAALYDATANRHLIERMAVSMAMSASALQPLRRTPAPEPALLALALPPGRAAGLPDSMDEIGNVYALYRRGVTIPPAHVTFESFSAAAANADVIHLAGHTERPSEDDGTALVFGYDRVTWRAIAERRLPRAPAVILAACSTLRASTSANVRTATLGEGFIAAGATDVIGTLAPIADADARDLFHAVQRRLAAGEAPAEALRAAQVEALAHNSSAWRSVASLTRCITRRERGA